jgi:hypothetical protein
VLEVFLTLLAGVFHLLGVGIGIPANREGDSKGAAEDFGIVQSRFVVDRIRI